MKRIKFVFIFNIFVLINIFMLFINYVLASDDNLSVSTELVDSSVVDTYSDEDVYLSVAQDADESISEDSEVIEDGDSLDNNIDVGSDSDFDSDFDDDFVDDSDDDFDDSFIDDSDDDFVIDTDNKVINTVSNSLDNTNVSVSTIPKTGIGLFINLLLLIFIFSSLYFYKKYIKYKNI